MLRKKILRWVVRYVIRPQWISFKFDKDSSNELGISIFGVVIGLYKADTIYPSTPLEIRKPEKREFGESIYTLEYIFNCFKTENNIKW